MRISNLLRCVVLALSVIVGTATTGCQFPPLDGPDFMVVSADVNKPIRWQLVEKRYGDLHNHGAAGDGQVDPNATTLVFEPLYAEQLTTEIYVSAFPNAVVLRRHTSRRSRWSSAFLCLQRAPVYEVNNRYLQQVCRRGFEILCPVHRQSPPVRPLQRRSHARRTGHGL